MSKSNSTAPRRRTGRDLTGLKFGRWLVLGRAPTKKSNGHRYWRCQCDRGVLREVYQCSLSVPVGRHERFDKTSITLGTETHTIEEWSEITGIQATVIVKRLNYHGWTVEKALTQPQRKYYI